MNSYRIMADDKTEEFCRMDLNMRIGASNVMYYGLSTDEVLYFFELFRKKLSDGCVGDFIVKNSTPVCATRYDQK